MQYDLKHLLYLTRNIKGWTCFIKNSVFNKWSSNYNEQNCLDKNRIVHALKHTLYYKISYQYKVLTMFYFSFYKLLLPPLHMKIKKSIVNK